jgi:hypothetical protein
MEREISRITDPEVDYTKIVKSPVYFEFIDVGEALNKLKEYENHCTVRIINEEVVSGQPFRLGDVVYYISSKGVSPNIHCAKVAKTTPWSVTLVFPSKRTYTYDISEIYKTYDEALAYLHGF